MTICQGNNTSKKPSGVGKTEGVENLPARMIGEKKAAVLFVSKGLSGQKPDRT
jgi:hypothetical protein